MIRLPRLTVRRWMVTVAITSVVLAGAKRSSDRCQIAKLFRPERCRLLTGNDAIDARILYRSAMHAKYKRAMWRPWESVAPDPPAPE
jgi:hypothetical protein